MKQVAVFLIVAVAGFVLAGAWLRRSSQTPSASTLARREGQPASLRPPGGEESRFSRARIPGTEVAGRRATPIGASLRDGESWTDLAQLSVSDPRANLLTGALASWVGRRARHCLPSDATAKAESAVQVVVRMSSTKETAIIDGRSPDVRVIEGAPLDPTAIQCVKDAVATSDEVPLSSVDPRMLRKIEERLPKGIKATFPDGFRGSAAMTMKVRCPERG